MEAETDNIFEINYQKEIDKAVSKGNYRFAVRLMFLQLLKNLSDKQVIHYRQDSTNFDYLLQLHQTRHYQDFFRLTRNYEYSWYGQFDIDPDTFSLIRKDFENFDVVDDTDVRDENNILTQTPNAIYDKAKEGRTELKIVKIKP